MPAQALYLHGLTASIPNMGNPNPPKRGKVVGWSDTAARRNVNFLRSVVETDLHGKGYALTLTLRDCPPTPKHWSSLTRSWMERQSRADMIRLHWVMEFQRRGVPHLHCAIWFPESGGKYSPDEAAIRATFAWVQIAESYGTGMKGQFYKPIDGVVGWFMYMSKHCSRSKNHYQRQQSQMPEAWKSSPRVWGYRGEWPREDPIKLDLTYPEFHKLRRLVKQARIAEARKALPLNRRQLSHLRRLLKDPDPRKSAVRPVSEWMSRDRQRELLRALGLAHVLIPEPKSLDTDSPGNAL